MLDMDTLSDGTQISLGVISHGHSRYRSKEEEVPSVAMSELRDSSRVSRNQCPRCRRNTFGITSRGLWIANLTHSLSNLSPVQQKGLLSAGYHSV